MEKTAKRGSKKRKPSEISHLAKRIKDLRVAKGYKSGEAFALDHQLSRTHYGRWERGSNITYVNLVKLAEAFDLTLEEFFSEGFD
ncbi:MAG TPA: helix-turn-helix domain-containing protein [Bacteroidia bacterium]|nr:helix-turn-helix domain-containing protein [Bacteroidia bacterium]